MLYLIKDKMLFLYGNADVTYKAINLKGAKIDFDWKTTTVQAEGMPDSNGNLIGKPIFKDGEKSYNTKKIAYNFKSKKGKVYEILTEESGGFVRLEQGKRTDDSSWFGKNAWYTTCNEKENPHFYIRAKKAKVVPNKLFVTGPANLVVADIPTPLYLPFGIFPLRKGQRNGIIFPQYGDSRTLGLFLKDGGYYIPIKDQYSLTFLGDIYTGGSWGIKTLFDYNIRYKVSGGLSFSYFRRRADNPDRPGAVSANDFAFTWRHSQDPKLRPLTTFTSSVNFQTSTYLRNNLVTDQSLNNTILNSNIVFSKSFRRLPISLTLSASHNQNLRNRSIRIDLPIFTFNVSRFAPFKSKISTGKIKWYENIGMNYNFEAKSFISTYDSILLKAEALDYIKYGARHSVRIDVPLTVFKYVKITPSFDYNGRFYFKETQKYWDPTTVIIQNGPDDYDTLNGRVITDTIQKFRAINEFSASINISTKLVGIFRFKNQYIKALRHIFTPFIGATYKPDFGTPFWNYYGIVQNNETGSTIKYSKFEAVQDLYGSPSQGLIGSINFGITNNFELKVYSKTDTVKHERNLPLIDNFSINGSYNFAADSLRLSPFRFSANSSIIPNMSINFGFGLSPYAVNNNNAPYEEWLWNQRKKLLRLTDANVNISGRLMSKKAANTPAAQNTESTDTDESYKAEKAYVTRNLDYYYDFNIPWQLTLGYNMNLTRGKVGNPDTSIITQSLSAALDFNLTKNWKIDINSGFDFSRLEPTLTTVNIIRDLHCWELSFNWTAFPVFYQTYLITLRVKSPVLQDLKLTKKRNYIDTRF